MKVLTSKQDRTSANGTIDSSGVTTSAKDLDDGTYNVIYFKTNSEDIEDGQMQVTAGIVEDNTFHDSVFTVQEESVSQNIYVVEQLTFSQEGTVDIVASEHQCDDEDVSRLAKFLKDDDLDDLIVTDDT